MLIYAKTGKPVGMTALDVAGTEEAEKAFILARMLGEVIEIRTKPCFFQWLDKAGTLRTCQAPTTTGVRCEKHRQEQHHPSLPRPD